MFVQRRRRWRPKIRMGWKLISNAALMSWELLVAGMMLNEAMDLWEDVIHVYGEEKAKSARQAVKGPVCCPTSLVSEAEKGSPGRA